MVKKVAIIALDPRASAFYGRQVQELFEEYVRVNSCSVREGMISNMERADLYLMSTNTLDNRGDVPQYIPTETQISEIHVTYLWETMRLLWAIPTGTRVLFVNMTEKVAWEATSGLNQLGVNHIEFVPFYPGVEPVEGIGLAVAPDEERYIPNNVKQVINIGQRCLTSETMIEAALKLGLEEPLETPKFQAYFSSVVTSTYDFDMMFARSRRPESQFDILMEILDEGIIGINERAEIFAMNRKVETITGLSRTLVMCKQAPALLAYLSSIECLKTKEKIEPRVIRINNVNVSVAVVPVLRREDCIGAPAIPQPFNDAENRQHELRNQLTHKGYRAKYTFEDVIGVSGEMLRTKAILRCTAYTGSPVLLIGETGTGKELFANAVHLASRREKGPLMVISCGAMPENLLESGLFGYEEGAFTGAKEGGGPGLFESAHRGTLFLDEVEGMSPTPQIKLSRVLREHEIMRVGGNKIISVDVRIMAATNESLEEKMRDGNFRWDLYYRLNILPVLIPPLYRGGEDVFLLMERFCRELKGEFVLSEEVKEIFHTYSWPGNIQELRSLAEYFCFAGGQIITVKDSPPTFQYDGIGTGLSYCMSKKAEYPEPVLQSDTAPWKQAMREQGLEPEGYWFVLKVLYCSSGSGETVGRERILEAARKEKPLLSQTAVRPILGIFREYGLARVGRGRGGSRITSPSRKIWEGYEFSQINHITNQK